MITILIGGIVAVLVIVGAVIFWKKQQSAQEQEQLRSFLRSALNSLEREEEMLSDGDIGWRILAKGESSIDLSHVVPGNAGDRDNGYSVLSDKAPRVAENLKQRDRLVDEISQHARNAASSLEGPIRRVVDHDKQKVSSEPEKFGQFKHMLLQNEEVWMMVLQSLLNGGQNADESTQYGKYWRARRDVYRKLAEKEGGEAYQKLNDLKEKLHEQTKDVQKHLDHMKQRMEYE